MGHAVRAGRSPTPAAARGGRARRPSPRSGSRPDERVGAHAHALATLRPGMRGYDRRGRSARDRPVASDARARPPDRRPAPRRCSLVVGAAPAERATSTVAGTAPATTDTAPHRRRPRPRRRPTAPTHDPAATPATPTAVQRPARPARLAARCGRAAVRHADRARSTTRIRPRARSTSPSSAASATGHDRVGSLLVNPGGPGVPGTTLVDQATLAFSEDLLDRFDIVGWDPRGTGQSSPVDCVDNLDPLLSARPDPRHAGREAGADRRGEELRRRLRGPQRPDPPVHLDAGHGPGHGRDPQGARRGQDLATSASPTAASSAPRTPRCSRRTCGPW